MNFVTYYRFLKRNQIPFVYYRYGDRVKIMSKVTKYEYMMSRFEWYHVHHLIGEPVPKDMEIVFEPPEESWMYDVESDHQ